MKNLVKVSQDLCISCGSCWVIDPEHFAQGEDGKAKVRNGQKDVDLHSEKVVNKCEKCEDAKASCPVAAISVEEVQEGKE